MFGYVLKRLLIMVLMIVLVSTMIFFLFRVMPGDPTAFLVDPSITPEARAQMLSRYGLDKGLWDQYLIFMKDLARLEFGSSYFYNRPVLQIIGEKLPEKRVRCNRYLDSDVFRHGAGLPDRRPLWRLDGLEAGVTA